MKRIIQLAIALLAMLALVSSIIIIEREISTAMNNGKNDKTEIQEPSFQRE